MSVGSKVLLYCQVKVLLPGMRIDIPPDILTEPGRIIKRCGYAEIKDREGKVSYIRRLRGYHYPRFHVYVENNSFNLHLDQKAPSYSGSPAHSGEYEGETVEKEAERIKQFIKENK